MKSPNNQELLTELYRTFQHGIRSGKAKAPREYLASIGLDYLTLDLGFNSGQFHHREPQSFKEQYASIGMLTLNPKIGVNKKGRVPYTCFGAYGIIYPLKDEASTIVNYYADRFKLETPKRGYLYKNKGMYPHYPKPTTTLLYLCDNPIETASLIQSGVLKNQQSVLSLVDGKVTDLHLQAIESLPELKEIRLITQNLSSSEQELLTIQFSSLEITVIQLGNNSLNTRLTSQSLEEFQDFLLGVSPVESSKEIEEKLEIVNPQKLAFEGSQARYEVVGNLSMDLGQLRVSLRIIHHQTRKVHRTKIDLFEHSDIQTKLNHFSTEFNANGVEADLTQLTELLEAHRDEIVKEEMSSSFDSLESQKELTPSAREEAMKFLQAPHLIQRLDKLIELSGIIGEENSRMTAFVIASSYKMPYPLHGLIQASSGKGKSHLINSIASLMPQEDVMSLSRITSRSLYNYQHDELMYKLILIQDENGLDEESLYAFRELQSAGFITSSTSAKNSLGKHQSRVTRVNSHFASLMASTKTEIYTDNQSRSVLMGIDESIEQTYRIIEYSNQVRAGLINKEDQKKARHLLRNCMRVLNQKEVINPFAHYIKLPMEAKMLRRLNSQFQDFTAQITLLNQYQRETDEQGRIITTKEDLQASIEIFFTSILFKVDELDSSNRQLFDKLKAYVLTTSKGKEHEFSRKEAREVLNLKKTRASEFFNLLQELEYIYVSSGTANKGYFYTLSQWDDGLTKLKQRIKSELHEQIKAIPTTSDR